MAESATLTIRMTEEFKGTLEKAAQAADQSITEYVTRALKVRMAAQCGTCGRSDHAIGAGFTQAYEKFVERNTAKDPVTISVLDGAERRVYRGRIRHDAPNDEGMLFLSINHPVATAHAAIPRGLITGWANDSGQHFRDLLDLGYMDGNAWATRGLARYAQ